MTPQRVVFTLPARGGDGAYRARQALPRFAVQALQQPVWARRPVSLGAGDPDLQQAQAVVTKLEKRGARFRRRVTSPSLELLGELAAQGLGTAILPQHLAARMKPRLTRPTDDAPHVVDSVCLVYRADAQRTTGAKVVLAALKTVNNVA